VGVAGQAGEKKAHCFYTSSCVRDGGSDDD
jgi:hypothetical protein